MDVEYAQLVEENEKLVEDVMEMRWAMNKIAEVLEAIQDRSESEDYMLCIVRGGEACATNVEDPCA